VWFVRFLISAGGALVFGCLIVIVFLANEEEGFYIRASRGPSVRKVLGENGEQRIERDGEIKRE